MIGRSTAHIWRNRPTGTRGGSAAGHVLYQEFYGRMPFLPQTHQMMSAVVALPDPVLWHSQDNKVQKTKQPYNQEIMIFFKDRLMMKTKRTSVWSTTHSATKPAFSAYKICERGTRAWHTWTATSFHAILYGVTSSNDALDEFRWTIAWPRYARRLILRWSAGNRFEGDLYIDKLTHFINNKNNLREAIFRSWRI